MGNSESSSSEFPYRGNNDESDKSKKKESEEETSAASKAIKAGAASKAIKAGAAIAGTALLAFAAWNLSSSSETDSTENKSQKLGVTNRSEHGGSTSFMRDPGYEPEGRTGDYNKLGDYKMLGSASRSIKVMSYNVWSNEEVEVKYRMDAIGKLIQKHSPDIILFQEVTPNIYQIFKSSQWWNRYKCSVSPKRVNAKYFCMLLSKLNVETFERVYFENSTKGIFWAELDVGSNNNLVVATCHLKSQTFDETYSNRRMDQAKEAIIRLNKYPNVVFGGDMNWDESTDGRFPLDHDWVDAWTEINPEDNGMTFPKRQKRFDRFICKLNDFKIIDIETIGKKAIAGISYCHNSKDNPVYPSDHFGLLLTISTI